MNKAILSLEAQAEEHAEDYVCGLRANGVQVLPGYYEQAFRKKFAELIVRECASMVDNMDSVRTESFHRADGSKIVVGDVLKKYFGISHESAAVVT